MTAILTLDHLSVSLPRGADRPFAIDDVSFAVNAGEIVCVVGESASGKSMTANAVMRLLPGGVAITGGKVLFEGRDLAALDEAAMRKVRGAGIAMIFQEPMTALNPLRSIGDQIGEMFSIHTGLSRAAIRARVLELLEEVRIPDPARAAKAYPHELSGGQRQRAMIAMALALDPRLLIADEPTTALDVTTQAQILELIRDLQRRKGTAVLFITHDFGVVAEIADRVVVMQQGRIAEQGAADEVLERPQHPYTRQLIAAVPRLTAPPPRKLAEDAILAIDHVSKTYRTGGFFGRGARVTHAVKDVSLALPRGATLGIVGESGSGKSTLARCLLRLIDPDGGAIVLDGKDLACLDRAAMRGESRNIQMVFQDPFASLNPRRTAGELVAQGPIVHGMPRAEAFALARELFGLIGLDPAAVDRHPHEFSGGQRQRIGLARALALRPKVLVADEPVSALDVSVQAQVLTLLADLRARLGLSMVFITHDLRVAAQICDLVAVMKDGEVVESGPVARVFGHPHHAYTRALLASIPGREFSLGRAAVPA
ncbi:ABC transporter ATP-binding protein [Bradyrhizobium sp. U87765 SZCCT0131]|uniref:ABC transporter ATP-binding protein n=1 Tax=unclassified Bradyrhizobium TaxID=2631580 RepID=UPI001BAD097D|nr:MULTISPECIES: ABC transporter ATP-binding protein [unclassified Bradyrhizobium]MBR1220961.1 ABC transporter ATP-binding protein [Bradyrhizobium sp. U87765 SZCCT0131]MBR1260219.1 ABC transporter ATP-binding protein [Bradyrhizobium sp. U87765 SZCCT0134]MBR1307532.1 ABC transporter ATP-binding protein [Bradyrhizobium sp. U87765 SZCCT0110]MBR1321486.1 ABC transporter ATP-binding protein [Bradyrhizobium sp. U87765 SZCCT0109]MBR1349799.1 ABC transporter ATP-binding protein [Bradyrhizobium sp. U87